MVNSKLFGFALEPRNARNYFCWPYPFEFRTRGKKNADTVPQTSNYHFVKLLATAIAIAGVALSCNLRSAYTGNLRSAYDLRSAYGTRIRTLDQHITLDHHITLDQHMVTLDQHITLD